MKNYASDHALQNHLKLKHMAGKKSLRIQYAEKVYQCFLKGEAKIPDFKYNLPENFIEVIF